jgi:hypothetical protein
MLTRRDFVKSTGAGTIGMVLPNLEAAEAEEVRRMKIELRRLVSLKRRRHGCQG